MPYVLAVDVCTNQPTTRKARMLEAASSALKQIMSIAASNLSACIFCSKSARFWRSPTITRTPAGTFAVCPRLNNTTSCPCSSNSRTIGWLIFPVPPTIPIFIAVLYSTLSSLVTLFPQLSQSCLTHTLHPPPSYSSSLPDRREPVSDSSPHIRQNISIEC